VAVTVASVVLIISFIVELVVFVVIKVDEPIVEA
jgi:hypothetical protein